MLKSRRVDNNTCSYASFILIGISIIAILYYEFAQASSAQLSSSQQVLQNGNEIKRRRLEGIGAGAAQITGGIAGTAIGITPVLMTAIGYYAKDYFVGGLGIAGMLFLASIFGVASCKTIREAGLPVMAFCALAPTGFALLYNIGTAETTREAIASGPGAYAFNSSILFLVILAISAGLYAWKKDECQSLQCAIWGLGGSLGLSLVCAYTGGGGDVGTEIITGLDHIGNGVWFGVNITLILVYIAYFVCEKWMDVGDKQTTLTIVLCGVLLTAGTLTTICVVAAKNGDASLRLAPAILFIAGLVGMFIFYLVYLLSANMKEKMSSALAIGLGASFAGITTFAAMHMQFETSADFEGLSFFGGSAIYSGFSFLFVVLMICFKNYWIKDGPEYFFSTVRGAAVVFVPTCIALATTVALSIEMDPMLVAASWIITVACWVAKITHWCVTKRFAGDDDFNPRARTYLVAYTGISIASLALCLAGTTECCLAGVAPTIIGGLLLLVYWGWRHFEGFELGSCFNVKGPNAGGFFRKAQK